MNNDNFLFISHRGESFYAPENTLAAINLAWERNINAVEIDVRLTKDNQIVVIHDKTTLRTGNKILSVEKNNYSQLQSVDVGEFKAEIWKGEKIPLLKNVIDLLPENKFLFIEIKTDTDGRILEPLINIFNSFYPKANYLKIIGFNFELMKNIKTLLPQVEVFWIIKKKWYLKSINLNKIIPMCKSAGLDGIDVGYGNFLNRQFIEQIKKNNLKIYTWTVDDEAVAEKLKSFGINGITSNRASYIQEIINLQYK